jgi:hypothetical protein
MFVSSFVVSLLVKVLNKKCGRKVIRREGCWDIYLAEVQWICVWKSNKSYSGWCNGYRACHLTQGLQV